MKNTCSVWTDTGFTKMKEITITNQGSTITNYVISLTINYESDMKTDYSDLRFKDSNSNMLSYWIQEYNSEYAIVLVLIPEIVDEKTIYMFYGNPSATDVSSFENIFSWKNRSSPDIMISFKTAAEGAWDPYVEYGGDKFLVAWEERTGPEDIELPLPDSERTIPGVIHGRLYDKDGTNPNPDPEDNQDIDISIPDDSSYHAENPSIAYGDGKFFAVWEENPANLPDDRYKSDIKGAFVNLNGEITKRITICDEIGGQFNPHICYDISSEQFFVVWEDSRKGIDDYDIRGSIYTKGGFVEEEIHVTSDETCEKDSWVCSDDNGNFMVVYNHGDDYNLGPFDIYAKRYDQSGSLIGSRITIAIGTNDVDYIFPAVSFNSNINRFFVTWNDGDISADPTIRDSYDGNIWGEILDINGLTIQDNFIIQAGTSYIRSDVVPYFNSMFFVSYDGIINDDRDIFGRIVSSEGTVLTDSYSITDDSSINVDWNNIAVSNDGNIFVTWEDERDLVSQYADSFGYVLSTYQQTGLSDITYVIDSEKDLVLETVVISELIDPTEFYIWNYFNVSYNPNSCDIVFDILSSDSSMVLLNDVVDGENISSISEKSIRLRATMNRANPTITPTIGNWSVTWYKYSDIKPPSTEITMDPSTPDGNNNWYTSSISVTFTASDVDSPPENITTYYKINNQDVMVYISGNPIVLSTDGTNSIEYWSEDNAGNQELPHNFVNDIVIDSKPPTIKINRPNNVVNPGLVNINGSIEEFSSGSGLEKYKVFVNEGEIINQTTSDFKIYFDFDYVFEIGKIYEIKVIAYDSAGNHGQAKKQINVLEKGVYNTGYIYLYDNPKIGPKPFLEKLNLTIIVNDTLYLIHQETAGVNQTHFVIEKLFNDEKIILKDVDMSNGCSINTDLKTGFYKITIMQYDNSGEIIRNEVLISKLLFINF